VTGRVFWEFLVPPEELAGVRAAWAPLKVGDFPNTHENHWLGKDGSRRLVSWSNTVLTNGAGHVEHIINTGIDITERKQAEQEVRKARDELELRVQERTAELTQAYDKLMEETKEREQLEEKLRQAHKMEAIGTLAGGIAHDFNNILAAIMGFTEMVIEDLPKDSQEEKHLHYVLKSAHRGKDLVKQILAFSRKTDNVRGQMSLTPIISETTQLLRASIPRTVEVVFKTTASSDTVVASPGEVQQILMNLGTNAALAMHEEGGTLEISLKDIATKQGSPEFAPGILPGAYVQLAVRDTGSGMTPDVMNRIFEPFFTTREVGKGTGMGLAVVYGIVKDLGGNITVESEPEVGSIFRVLLPKATSDMISEPVKPEPTPTGKERVLFVDDEEFLVKWGQAVLERLGYAATALTDSTEALKLFSSDPYRFDLVITDQSMPGITGIQLAKRFLKMRNDIPIILCTGHSDSLSPEIAKNAGIKEFLMKPLGKQELAEVIRRVLDATWSEG
jgi:signal transduction histidine kinase/ActR/RegA family two-component response regulator